MGTTKQGLLIKEVLEVIDRCLSKKIVKKNLSNLRRTSIVAGELIEKNFYTITHNKHISAFFKKVKIKEKLDQEIIDELAKINTEDECTLKLIARKLGTPK